MSSFAQAVANNFSKAAPDYQQWATVQHRSAEQLMQHATLQGKVLDIGCGPGGPLYQRSIEMGLDYIGLDLSPGMLTLHPATQLILANAEAMPLASNSIDGIISNMAMQWGCLDAIAHESLRVLRVGGRLYSHIVCAGSLRELASCGFSVNTLPTIEQVRSAFAGVTPQADVNSIMLTEYFSCPKALIRSVKGVGASAVNANSGLRGKQWLARTLRKLETIKTEQGYPLTYQVACVTAIKS